MNNGNDYGVWRRGVEWSTARRMFLSRHGPTCPVCGESSQIQLTEYIENPVAQWKCRICKHKFGHEPEPEQEAI